MPNQALIQIIKQGTDVWNKWRQDHPREEIYLSEAKLREAKLREAYLIGAHLNGADLSRADLSGAKLSGAHLYGAHLNGADLSRADLSRAKLREAKLREAYLIGAHLDGADLSGADLSRAYLTGADLSRADLSRAYLTGTDLTGADLTGASLDEADLSRADLSRAHLTGASLDEADLTGASLDEADLTGASLRVARLCEASLRVARLRGAKLTQANLTRASLIQAILRRADLTEANLTRAYLTRANLIGASLIGANLIGADITEANLDDADLSRVTSGDTIFANTDISNTKGLENIIHGSGSTIGTDTLLISQGKIPEIFLRGCGLSDWEICAAKLYNPNLTNYEIDEILYKLHDIRAHQPIQISPVFISYSHADKAFVDRIEKSLNERGVRFWRDIHDATAGRLEIQIDRAITQNQTVLLILSENSMNSDWVQHEVRKARDLEKELKRDVLCPLALDDSWKNSSWPARIMEQVKEYNILNFSNWQDNSHYHKMFGKLIDGLNIYYKK